MSKYWFDYIKHCYDLVLESEGNSHLILDHDIEAYLVHLMARNFERTDIGSTPVAIQIMEAVNSGRAAPLLAVADECLLIHSYPFKRGRWPTDTYYQEIGITAYGLAGHAMETHFIPASKILTSIFNQSKN
jgi:hypothetical protein